MAEILTVPGAESTQASEPPSSDTYTSSRKITAPAPNPDFSFPMIPLDQATPSLGNLLSPPVRPGSRHRPANISVDNAPTPWRLVPPSPTKFGDGPDSTHSSPTRGGGASGRSNHKRAGSEFIGGDGSSTGPGLMSTSPTKGDGALASIPTSGRRRGHAHRRSGAISHHDLSMILKPSSHEPLPTRPGSLPTTPTALIPPTLPHAASQPVLNSSQADKTPPATPKGSETRSANSPPPSRPRVGFSDTIEFIPRPLSTISSETSSSMSTIRASHSVTGSITSIISNGTPSPSSARKSQYTADILERYRQDMAPTGGESPTPNVTKRRGSPPPPIIRTSSESLQSANESETLEPQKARSNGDRAVPTLLKGFEASAGSSPALQLPAPPHSSADTIREFSRSNLPVQLERPRSSPEAKVSKKQKKVKVWAESILSRRAKGKLPEELTSTPTISRENFATLDGFSLDDVNFDDDNTCVIKSPDYAPPTSAGSATNSPNTYEDDEPDHAQAVLDLDAAWEEDDSSQGFAAAKKRMHSGGGTGGFTGPGMHYHRRAESAPALTPVSPTSTLRRPGSNSQMADVFEEVEEEEEEEAARDSLSVQIMEPAELSPMVVDSATDDPSDEPSMLNARQKAAENLPAIVADVESLSQHSEVQTPRDVPELSDSVEIVDTVDEPRFSVVTKSSDESTITPTLPTPNPFSEMVAPLSASPDTETTTPPTSAIDESHVSFDGPALKTAASSITDRSTWSSSRPEAGGPSSFSYSTEDVPSLTSSASTTFSGYHVQAQTSPTALERPSAERSYSFSGVTSRRTRPMSAVKRSSLASLSRLVGSSHGERSKLSLEVYPSVDQEEVEKKKRNRISRLMKFWKPKGKVEK